MIRVSMLAIILVAGGISVGASTTCEALRVAAQTRPLTEQEKLALRQCLNEPGAPITFDDPGVAALNQDSIGVVPGIDVEEIIRNQPFGGANSFFRKNLGIKW